MDANIEDLTSSLVREFLHRKKCKETLKTLDDEWPRSSSSINSRSKLAEALHIENWVVKNKSSSPSFSTMLEIILCNIIQLNFSKQTNEDPFSKKLTVVSTDKKITTANTSLEITSKTVTNMQQFLQPDFTKKQTKTNKYITTVDSLEDIDAEEVGNVKLTKVESFTNTSALQNIPIELNPKISQRNNFLVSAKKKSLEKVSLNNHAVDDPLNDLLSDIPVGKPSLKSFFNKSEDSRTSYKRSGTKVTDYCEDSLVFTYEVAKSLRALIFGSFKQGFTSEWFDQSFTFRDISFQPSKLRYGIVQKKGGPCGVLAAVQATVLKHLLFPNGIKIQDESCLAVGASERTNCLAKAITEMIWRAGQTKTAILALLCIQKQFKGLSHEYRPDGVTEYVKTSKFSSKEELHATVQENINGFEYGKGSCILLLYSAILSRGLAEVRNDMDEPNGKLMGAHNYCTQEMINLLLSGKATSNAFDKTIELGETLLKGIDSQSDIGMLSLFEHYGSCKIGKYYKIPKFPIWIVCSESHFTVLFGLTFNFHLKSSLSNAFDLYYFDGLANQDEVIKLTVNPGISVGDKQLNRELTPPLEHCIRTKWPKAHINWNGTEPLL